MSGPFPEFAKAGHVGQSTPVRPKHLTTRSISEISPPSVPKAHRHHHHPHIHHRHKDPQFAQPISQSNTNVENTSRSEGHTPSESRDVSRRGSVYGGKDDNTMFVIPEKRLLRPGEVKEEREKGVVRATELRNALLGLNTLSNNTTRRLDNTYYSVLEKLSMLQNTITSLKELADMTRHLNGEFKAESKEVQREFNTQLDGFEGFEDQEKRIDALKERVQKGRDKIQVLGGRVDIVRQRVEGWEKAEEEWQEKTRKRLRILWILMSIVAAIIIILVAFQYTPAKTQGPGVMKPLNASGLLGKIPDMEAIRNESWSLKRKSSNALEELRKTADKPEEDPRLKVFDEL